MTRDLAKDLLAMAIMLALAACIGLALYCTGRAHGEAAGIRAEAARQQAITQALQADRERGEQASAALGERLQAMTTRYTQLETTFHALRQRIPLVVPGPVRVVSGQRDPGGAQGGAAGPDGHGAADGAQQPAAEPGHRLSDLAVRVWDDALAGVDLSPSACSADAAAERACAAGSGLTVDDAWANHITNARSCAEDRERFRALIEFLKTRQATLGEQ